MPWLWKNAFSPIVFNPLPNFSPAISLQFRNASFSMISNEFGSVTLCSFLQFWNAYTAMCFSPSFSSIVSKLWQSWKAFLSIFVSDAGSSAFFSASHIPKAPSGKVVMPSGIWICSSPFAPKKASIARSWSDFGSVSFFSMGVWSNVRLFIFVTPSGIATSFSLAQ